MKTIGIASAPTWVVGLTMLSSACDGPAFTVIEPDPPLPLDAPPPRASSHEADCPAAAPVWPGHWWPFDLVADGGTPDIADERPGTVVGDLPLAEGLVGNALLFEGASSFTAPYVNLGQDVYSLDAFTIEVWINPDAFFDAWGGAGFILADGRDCCGWNGGGIGLHLAGDGQGRQLPRAFVYRPDNSQVVIQSATLMNPEEWHHVVMTFDGMSLNVYQDGELTGTTGFPPTAVKDAGLNLQVGRHQPFVPFRFHGLIDELKVYDRALSALEVADSYDAFACLLLDTPEELLEALVARVEAFLTDGSITDPGIARSLRAKLEGVRAALERGNSKAARNQLEAFVHQVEAQKGNKISTDAAEELIDLATRLMEEI